MIDFSSPWLLAMFSVVASILAGYVVRAIFVKRLRTFFKRTSTDVDDLVLEALNRYLPLWFLLGGVLLATRPATLPISMVEMADRVCAGVFVLTPSLSVTPLLTAMGVGSLAVGIEIPFPQRVLHATNPLSRQ